MFLQASTVFSVTEYFSYVGVTSYSFCFEIIQEACTDVQGFSRFRDALVFQVVLMGVQRLR